MSSFLWVQLALLAACLSLGSAEGDPLPPGLVELVRSSPIESIEDLQLLLFTGSVDAEVSEVLLPSGQRSNNTSRLPRSLDAQPAQQALCKVRTEVMEVTRAMLDRSNADFMLWPPCVEVQRCSGCCNTKSLQCVPVLVHTRHLQVMKIQYVEKRPIYSKAIVSVHDHVECRCQAAPQPAAVPKKKQTPRRQHKEKAEGGPGKARSKEELHHEDQLKHNQLEDQLEQHWSIKGASSEPGAWKDGLNPGQFGPQPVQNGTRQLGVKEPEEPSHHSDMYEGSDSNSVKDTPTPPSASVGAVQLDHMERAGEETRGDSPFGVTEGNERRQGGLGLVVDDGDQQSWMKPMQTHTPPLRGHASKPQRPGSNSSTKEENWRLEGREGANQSQDQRLHPTEETNQRPESRFTPQEEADQRRKDNETPESERSTQHKLKEEQERKEVSLLHRRRGQEEELLRRQTEQREEEEHRPHQSHQTATTMLTTGTVSMTSTRAPSTLAGPRPPAQPGPPNTRSLYNERCCGKSSGDIHCLILLPVNKKYGRSWDTYKIALIQTISDPSKILSPVNVKMISLSDADLFTRRLDCC
ncbi:hypothetical protein UPYG_G00096550 [Umbra pygmaea]|uniref:Platelet-derived growth factor subunit B n=1 Tax=Umbra pygmaea TaxID=75934 RepID=A0ABD0X004_UMBPY